MLERARRETYDESIVYRRDNLDDIDLGSDRFNVAYSSLTLHYLRDLDRLLGVVHRCLAPAGRFVFSVEHPIVTAPTTPGFVERADESVTWPSTPTSSDVPARQRDRRLERPLIGSARGQVGFGR